MKTILATLAGGLLIGAFAASYAELPPPPPEEKAAEAAKADKAASEKAKAAKDLDKAQDKAVANYKKNKGSSPSSSGATAQPDPQQDLPAAQAPAQPQGAEQPQNSGR